MSSGTPDGVRAELDAALAQIRAGTYPQGAVLVTGVATTVSAVLDFTGASTLSDGSSMYQTFVAASGATTFTGKGWLRIQLSDTGGNITYGNYYIPFGILT